MSLASFFIAADGQLIDKRNAENELRFYCVTANFGLMVTMGGLSLGLLCFAYSTHEGAAIRNVTTNESLRNKWNARPEQVDKIEDENSQIAIH